MFTRSHASQLHCVYRCSQPAQSSQRFIVTDSDSRLVRARMLSYIKMNNFKTYVGEIVVGPLRKLTVVLGKNGSGKSNFTDAIGFVMGTGLDMLRASNFVTLIHGGNFKKPASDRASVTAVFNLEDGSEKEFTRIIKIQQHRASAVSSYLINGKVVDEKVYLAELQSLGVCVNFENFFIFQGNVETFVRMKAKNFTSVIEDLSGSGTLKTDYDGLHRKMRKLEDRLNQLVLQRKTLMIENKKKKAEMLIYKEYHNLINELEQFQLDEKLLLLYDNERRVKTCEEEYKQFQDSIWMLKQQRTKALEELKHKDLSKLGCLIAETTSDLRKTETECQKKCQKLKSKERTVEHLTHKVKLVFDSLERQKQLEIKQKQIIQQLEKDLAEVQTMEAEYKKLIQSQETDELLEEERVKEYDKLKQEAGKRTAVLRQQLYTVEKEQKDLQEILDRELCKKVQINRQQQGIKNAISDANIRFQKIDCYIKEKELSLHEKKKLQDEVQAKVNSANEEIEKVKSDLETLVKHLNQMNIGSELFLKEKKKQDIVKDLKMAFGDNILGRMSDLCHPAHERYKLAITKVMGKNLNALVVKNKQTALEVIHYLKTFHLPPEIILPLDTIKVYPIQGRLRNLCVPSGENVKLLYDVIHCKVRVIEPAVRFAVSNCLLCETTDTAMYVAYKLDPTVKYNVVALDGTYYKKGGIVSSGKVSLQQKAKQWLGQDILQAQNRKTELREKLRDLQKQSRTIPNVRQTIDEICSVEIRVKYVKEDRKKLIEKITELQSQLEELGTHSADADSLITDLEQKMVDHCNKRQTIENEMNLVEDTVFSDFCHETGIATVREYEGIGLRLYRERAEKRSELSTHKQNILTQLKYENEKLTFQTGTLKKEQELNELKAELETAKLHVQQAEEDKINHSQKLKDLKLNLQTLKTKRFSTEKERVKAQDDAKRLTDEIKEGTSQLNNVRLRIENLKYEHRNLLVQCKVHGLNIPMRRGTMADIHESEPSSLNESSSTSQGVEQDERRILIDYSRLSDSLKEASDVKKAVKELGLNIEDTMLKIRTKKPNMKVVEEFDAIQLSLKDIYSEVESTVKILRHDGHKFKKIREDRTRKFMECFSSLETEVDAIYKELYEAQNGAALLTLENPEEPYLAGVRYSVQVPHKRCVAMDCLSGGEAAMASLAFMFALNRYRKAPIIILDEPDGSLDQRNVSKFAEFLKQNIHLQIIIITHRNRSAYATVADDVIGIVKEIENGLTVSKMCILDLTEYQMNE